MSLNQSNKRPHLRLLEPNPNDDWAPWANITNRRNPPNELLKIALKPKNTSSTETSKAKQRKPPSSSTQSSSGRPRKLAKSKSYTVPAVQPTKPKLRKIVTSLEAISASSSGQNKSTSLDISFLKKVGSVVSKPSSCDVSGSAASPMQSCKTENDPPLSTLLESSDGENLVPSGPAEVVTLRRVPRPGVKLWEQNVGKPVLPHNIFACPKCDRTLHELDGKISVLTVCGHAFCGDCVLPPPHMKKACPLCRAPATKDDIDEFLVDFKTNIKTRVSM